MLRIAVALGNRSKILGLDEVRKALFRHYGSEAVVFGVPDRITSISDIASSSPEGIEQTRIPEKVERFVDRARQRYPGAGVYVGIKSVSMELRSGVWEDIDYVSIATEGSEWRSLSILGQQGHRVITQDILETMRSFGIKAKVEKVGSTEVAEHLISLIEFTAKRVRESTPKAPAAGKN